MAESFIRQGITVICTNMTCSEPRKIGTEDPEKSVIKAEEAESNRPLLHIKDNKISDCFICKMPIKKWGGLAALCAGIAIVGAIALCVVTGGAAAPFLLAAAAATATKAAIIAAAAVAVISIGYSVYSTAHACDETTKLMWEAPHDNVKFMGEKALLNRSYMLCPVGGTIKIIVKPEIAKEAAKFISNNNKKEITAQLVSKAFQGAIGALTGGATLPSLAITVGFDMYFESSKSNENFDLLGDVKNEAISNATGIAESAIESGAQHGMSAFQAWCWKNIGLIRIINEASEESISSAFNMAGMAADAGKHIWKDFAKGLGLGLLGGVINFGIDQFSNWLERGWEKEANLKAEELDAKDSDNHISILALNS